jgi:Tol biopolymer transport system component/pimeloyl-ACP methyl ester carboxylesterase
MFQRAFALLILLLGTVACHQDQIPAPTTSPTTNQSHKKDAEVVATTPPTIATATSVPPTITATSLPPLSGSGGGVIAFQSDRDRQDEIYVMNADGSDQRLLISNQRALDSMPAWSPDGTQIAFASRERGKDFEICIVIITENFQVTGEIFCLTDNDFEDLHPTWSPDGTQIAFFSKRDNDTEIYVINLDGTGERALTENDVDDKDPAWSPEGSQIAFVSSRDGDNEIFVMKLDGSDQVPLTDNDFMDRSPAWSPNGSQIAFISDRNGEQHLFVMESDGSHPQQLTGANFPWNDDPSWSPDGTQIAFRANNGGHVDIYIINADGNSTPQQLTHNAEIDQDRAPAWRPVSNHGMDENIRISTHSLHIRCWGEGGPTVVIDTGVGDTLDRWGDFQLQVAEFTHVCTYNRAGYGTSEVGPLPRHSQRLAGELHHLLEKAGIKGPYLLVGHSLGGLTIQVFADRYPNQVAGLILLDPPPLQFITGQAFPELFQMLEDQALELQNLAEATHQSADPEAQSQANYLEAIASEHAALIAESASQVAAIESFGDVPLVVIGSGIPNPAFGQDAEAYQQFWIEQNRELADKSTNGRFVLAQESSHYIHEDAPDLVLDAIREMVK